MSNLSVRGLPPETVALLKKAAGTKGESVNTLVVRLISQGMGKSGDKPKRQRFDDLDALAGSWSAKDARDFEKNAGHFGIIDPGLWS